MLKTIRLTCVTFAIAAGTSNFVHAGNQAETLMLEQLFDATAASYPSLIAAKIEAQASTEDVVAMERIRWPAVSATIESYTGTNVLWRKRLKVKVFNASKMDRQFASYSAVKT